MLLPLFCILLANVIASFLLADVIAIVFVWWQMLLPLWLLFLPLVGMLYHFVADVIANLLADVIAMLLLLCLWQMLWPLWLMVLLFVRLM